jgi:hypothetical protein
MDEILRQIGSDPAKARRRSFEKVGADWYELTRVGSSTARRKLRPDEIRRLNPAEGEPE